MSFNLRRWNGTQWETAGEGTFLDQATASATYAPLDATALTLATEDDADPAGLGDSADAMMRLVTAAYDSRVDDVTGGTTNKLYQRTIDLPAGQYRVADIEALLPSTFTIRSQGLRIRGAGREATRIIFEPTTANAYLLNNADAHQHLTFEDMTFISTVATASFMRSSSSGGAQNYVFNRVNWRGTWKYGIELVGTNNNSEFSFFHCGIYGQWTAFQYAATTGSDQFLNYNYFACQVEYAAGHFIDMARGGNINVWGGSFIHLDDVGTEQIFFRLTGNSHARGVCRLLVAGTRFEHKHALSKLIYTEWPDGNITFLSCDASSQAGVTGADGWVTAKFVNVNTPGPNVVFDGCSVMGKHEWVFNSTSYNYPHRATYRSCQIYNHASAHAFVITTAVGVNRGGRPPVRFVDCFGGGGTAANLPFDCTVNWESAAGGRPDRHVLSVKNADAKLVTGTATLVAVLPVNSVITSVTFLNTIPTGADTSTSWEYALRDGNAAVVATAGGAGSTAFNTGWAIESTMWRRCVTDQERTLTLSASNVTTGSLDTLLLIEYIA